MTTFGISHTDIIMSFWHVVYADQKRVVKSNKVVQVMKLGFINLAKKMC